ncbi:MAG: hypothetical protein JO148_08700 [Acidimicrobiia bacterium]|nr:hypothetical protein [Acidimicrobiia bacterium]
MQYRPRAVVVTSAGLAALVLALLVTPDVQAFVFAAWVVIVAGVAAVAIGIAMGFRHDARLDQPETQQTHYLTADWIGGAQLFTVGDRAEPPPPEVTPEPLSEPTADPEMPPAVLPHPPSEPEDAPAGAQRWTRYPRVAAAFVLAEAVREVFKPGRVAR